MSKHYTVASLPGEGVGPEVVDASLRVLFVLAELEGFSVSVKSGLIGEPALIATSSYLPQETIDICQSSDGILFGAVSKGGILELRKHFDFFANLRPVKVFDSLVSSSSLHVNVVRGTDILFVRELVSGIYFGPSGRSEDSEGAYGYHTMLYRDHEIRRVARVALQQAQCRGKHLVVAHKENALPHLPWSQLVKEEAATFPDILVEPMLVDNLAMQLVLNPRRFDVILAGNLFGDILSDIGGALVGSIGLLPSASLNEHGFGLYEAIHGTAPDIAGRNLANPIGTIGAVGMMLQQWGEKSAALRLQSALESVLALGIRTNDLKLEENAPYLGTSEFVLALIQRLYESSLPCEVLNVCA